MSTSLLTLLYVADTGRGLAMISCLTIGFASAGNMMAFSTVADVMKPRLIGTSAAIVTASRLSLADLDQPTGGAIGLGVDAGFEPKSLALVQYASWPLIAVLVIALALALFMKETYPKS